MGDFQKAQGSSMPRVAASVASLTHDKAARALSNNVVKLKKALGPHFAEDKFREASRAIRHLAADTEYAGVGSGGVVALLEAAKEAPYYVLQELEDDLFFIAQCAKNACIIGLSFRSPFTDIHQTVIASPFPV